MKDKHAGNIADPQSLNRYAYSLNDPANMSDPSGMDPCTNVEARLRKLRKYLEIASLDAHVGGPSLDEFLADPAAQDPGSGDDGCILIGGGGGGGGGGDLPLIDQGGLPDPCAVNTCVYVNAPAPPLDNPLYGDPSQDPDQIFGPYQVAPGGGGGAGLVGAQQQPAPPCAFNIRINNRAGLGAEAISTAQKQIAALFGAYVGVNFVSSGADYTLNVVDAAPNNSNWGQQSSWGPFQGIPAVYPNNISQGFAKYPWATNRVVGTVGAHELVHRITGINDLPYDSNVPNDLMSVDSNPGAFALFKNDELRLTQNEGFKLQTQCQKKHP